ncbi:C2H2-type zinc finger transcription factor [Mucor lusitanicus CBS 277.49]|uniref:C2H2-type zinc finger transcription factor n=2 Tax=Mucor circinelloides f. lusitanicus TaxID=29924 RepID=A0A162QTK7_MUCCL|nr:C2H2-type zinc finger transcription factor [Mucor lusitanicus CBS 277.49]
MPPSITKASTMSLPMDMQQLSLEKKKPPETRRDRTHSRSYSDFIYPTNTKHTTLKEAQQESAAANHQRAHVQQAVVEQEKDGIKEEDEYEEEDEEEEEETTQVNISRSNSSCRYTCPYCNKGFTRPSSLRTHTFSHTGEKPFVCTEPCCGRKFSVQSNLRRHLRIHRSNKPTTLFLSKNIH